MVLDYILSSIKIIIKTSYNLLSNNQAYSISNITNNISKFYFIDLKLLFINGFILFFFELNKKSENFSQRASKTKLIRNFHLISNSSKH